MTSLHFNLPALSWLRSVKIYPKRFACLLRADHPLGAGRLSAADYLAAEHIVIRAEGRSREVLESI